MDDYDPADWSKYHALPLDVAAAARMEHNQHMERMKWPEWKQEIHKIVCKESCHCSS